MRGLRDQVRSFPGPDEERFTSFSAGSKGVVGGKTEINFEIVLQEHQCRSG